MTVEQLVTDLTAEFDECGIITAQMIEDNLDLIFENFTQWHNLLEPDVFEAFITRLEDPTAIYHSRVKDFSFKQRKAISKDGIIKSENFEKFLGFLGLLEKDNNQKTILQPSLIPELEEFIKAVSVSIQVDTGMVIPAVLVVSGLSVVKKCIIHVTGQGDHTESPNIYVAVMAEPSEKKSPTMKEVTWPVYEYERKENERRQPDISEYELKKKILEKKIKGMTEAVANSYKSSKSNKDLIKEADIIEVQRELDSLKAVAPLRLIADDVTPEMLIKLLSQNDERMSIMSAEGGIFGMIAGRYSNDSNMDVYLKGYSGDELSTDRMTRSGQNLKEPLLSVLVYVQPYVIEQVLNNAEFVSRGLPARFLFTQPPSMVGMRVFRVEAIPDYRKDELWNIINRLLNIPIPEKPHVVELSKDAAKIAERYHYEVERELSHSLSPGLQAWTGKLYGNTMRIALILHCIHYIEEFPEHEIDAETMQNAITLGRYFLEQAKITYAKAGLADSQEVKDAKYILSKIDSIGKTEMKLSDLQQICRDRVGMEKKKDMVSGLNCLIRFGFIRFSTLSPNNPNNPKNGGRPPEMIYVNPEYIKWKEQQI